MNDLPTSSDPGSQPKPSFDSSRSGTPAQEKPPGTRRWLLRPLHLALGVLALLLVAQWWTSNVEIRKLRAEMARRLQAGDGATNETKIILKSVQESAKEVQAKLNVLESKQGEAQSQQLALEQMYQDLSKNRDDWALAEIELVLSTASQQLQLAGNVRGAVIALQNADARLARSDKPQFITIRRAIANDLEKLKSLPNVDLTGITVRLDSAVSQVDGMPLLSDEKPVLPPTQPKNSRRDVTGNAGTAKASSGRGNGARDWISSVDDTWQSWTNEMWGEIRTLVVVRRVDTPEALLLSPNQAYFARENLKLRLLNARLALLSRNDSMFRTDLSAAQSAIAKYFDTRSSKTIGVQELLKQVQGSELSIGMPTLADSLNAVRNYKAKP